MTERKCKGCGYSGDLITFYDEAAEYCTMCEYDNIPTIDGLKAEVERLQESLVEAMTHITSNMIEGADALIKKNEETLAEIARIKA